MALTTQQKYDEAVAAYHDVMMGNRIYKVTTAGRSVEYTQANIADLNNYIEQLRLQLGAESGVRRRVMSVRHVFDKGL